MEKIYTNRYNTFCTSLMNLSRSCTADPNEPFVLGGTVQNFNLTFDIAWKVMRDILVKSMEILDFATGSPRQVLKMAFQNGIIDDDRWMDMLRSRNQLAHDYDGTLARKEFANIIGPYFDLFEKFRETAKAYMKNQRRHL